MASPTKTSPIDALMDSSGWEILPAIAPQHSGELFATHRGVMKIGSLEIEVMQLNDGQRIITEDGMKAFFNYLASGGV